MTERFKNGRKKEKNNIFSTKIFDIYKICCIFAKKFFGNTDNNY